MSGDLFDGQARALNAVREALAASPLVASAGQVTVPGARGPDGTVRLALADGTCVRADLTVIGHRPGAGPGAPFLDTLPFDWSRPQAGRLRDALADVFPHPGPVTEMAAGAGIPPAGIFWDQPMSSAWRDLIDAASRRGRLRELLAAAAAADLRAAAALRDLGWQESPDDR
jgi:hypothetical protein